MRSEVGVVGEATAHVYIGEGESNIGAKITIEHLPSCLSSEQARKLLANFTTKVAETIAANFNKIKEV